MPLDVSTSSLAIPYAVFGTVGLTSGKKPRRLRRNESYQSVRGTWLVRWIYIIAAYFNLPNKALAIYATKRQIPWRVYTLLL